MNTERIIRHYGDARELAELLGEFPETIQQWHCVSSPERLATWAATVKRGWHAPTWETSNEQAEFCGTRSMRTACELAFRGWPEGAARAARLRDKINASLPVQSRFVSYAMAGAYPSVPRFVGGNPMHMRALDSARARRKPVVTLLSNGAANCNVPAATFVNRAAVCAALVDVIESAGFACHVVYFATTRYFNVHACVMATLKEPHAPADIARLAFGMGHPSMFRRLCFASYTQDTLTRALGLGLGHAQALRARPEWPRAQVYVLPEPATVLFGSENAAEKIGLPHVIAELAKAGCPAFREHEAFCEEGAAA